MKEFRTKAEFDDEPAEVDVQHNWQLQASAFLRRHSREDEASDAAAKVVKYERLKSFDFCCAVDNWLVLMAGKGLDRYVDDRWDGVSSQNPIREPSWEAGKAVVKRDWLWIATDRASCNLTGKTYLVNEKHCLINQFGDTCHYVTNEIKSAAGDANFNDMGIALVVSLFVVYVPIALAIYCIIVIVPVLSLSLFV